MFARAVTRSDAFLMGNLDGLCATQSITVQTHNLTDSLFVHLNPSDRISHLGRQHRRWPFESEIPPGGAPVVLRLTKKSNIRSGTGNLGVGIGRHGISELGSTAQK